MSDIDNLMELAGKATPGPWDTTTNMLVRAIRGDRAHPIYETRWPLGCDSDDLDPDSDEYISRAEHQQHANRDYIAALDPETVTALCKVVKCALAARDAESAIEDCAGSPMEMVENRYEELDQALSHFRSK